MGNVTKQEERSCTAEGAEEGRGCAPAGGWGSPVGSSARAVGGRRLPSTEAHDQFLCKRRSRTGEEESTARFRCTRSKRTKRRPSRKLHVTPAKVLRERASPTGTLCFITFYPLGTFTKPEYDPCTTLEGLKAQHTYATGATSRLTSRGGQKCSTGNKAEQIHQRYDTKTI